jgi:hypothetical protein
MSIMAIYRLSGIDRETFARYRREVPIEPIPEGAISHHVAFDGDEFVCVDIWESEAQLNAFARDRVNPGLVRLGLPLAEPRVLELHALWTAPDAERHNLAAPAPAVEHA